ncbi:MAG: hypothetical protein HXY44_04765 [Syntrophaceae bacterium]|nr:hypothetical protein [Syntrophaceae bacterium]
MTSNEIEKNVRELQYAIIVAELNYEIWWVYKEKNSRKLFVAVLDDYPLYFKTSLHAHFVAMVISLYRLYEPRKDTINLPQLLSLLKKHSRISDQEIKSMESDINSMKPLWKKVSILRNNLFGHRSSKLVDDDVWEKASVTPNQFKKLIDDSKRLLNRMTRLWDRRSHAFNLSATSDTLRLLEDLKRLNEENL